MKRKEPTNSEDPIYEASSKSTPPQGVDYEGKTKRPKGKDYEVFLSFRGKDTRKGFTDYLYTSLVNAGIHVFRDDNELQVGEEIGPELLYSITQSMISIPIISENYPSSKWCLCELAHMLACKRSRGQLVLPIFYKVKPSQLRHPIGQWRDAINAHKENLDEMVVKKWEKALEEVSSLKGWESEKIHNGHEGALVDIVVGKVMSELKRLLQLNVPKQLVGIGGPVEEIMSWINSKFSGTRIIGIYGMGGIGKTTLAKVLYNKLSNHFEYLSFVANIRETSRHNGIECLQKQLIFDITRSSWDVSNVDEGIAIIKSRFMSKKILVVLDDMDDYTHLNALVGDGTWFEIGSIMIITTRNKSILDEANATHKYQLKELPSNQSLILFSRHAFRQDSPSSDYEVISRDVVSTTGGLPLALEVIGSFLRGKSEEVWKYTLKKLKKVPYKKVQEKLKISYEALEDEEQQIFLDIACFFIGSHKQNPSYMWGACDFFPGKGIEGLSLMSLINIDKDDKLMMHDQLRDMGREIVRLENPKEPEERSRLWIYEEAVDVIDNCKGTKKIEALSLDKCVMGRKCTAEQFKEMANLRLLQVDGANFTGNFQSLLPQLRWLQWKYCPSNFATTNFHPKKLVVLDLSYGEISEDWGGWVPLKVATELKLLNLTHCQSLKRTPDLSTFKRLESLILAFCTNLEELHPSIGDIKTLVSLNVSSCSKLKELPKGIGRMIELRDLDIQETGIEELPESIGAMKELKVIFAHHCEKLAYIPSSIGNLASQQSLFLNGCSSLTKIPETIGNLASLIELDLKGTSITKLPESIGNLQNLRILKINEADITELPDAIGMLAKLQKLEAWGCKNLKRLPSNICKLISLEELLVGGCEKLRELPELPSGLIVLTITCQGQSLPHLSQLTCLKKLRLCSCPWLECVPKLSIGLSELYIKRCGKLKVLTTNLSNLKHLRVLEIYGCPSLERSPEVLNFRGTLMKRTLMELRASGNFNKNLLPFIFPFPHSAPIPSFRSFESSAARFGAIKPQLPDCFMRAGAPRFEDQAYYF